MAPASQTAMEEPLNPLPGVLRMFMARPRRGSRCAPDPAPRVLGLSLCGALFLGACGADKAPLDPLLSDDRIAPLLAPCARAGPFTADTSHMLPLLVAKLESGQRDVLHRAKEELAELDEVAIPALGALLDRHLTEAYMAGLNQNILEVAVMMEGDAGRPLFVKALDHPQEILRTTAVRGLARHGRPADFDLLLPWIDLAPHLESAAEVALALHGVDRERFQQLVAEWLRDPERAPLLRFVAPFAPEVTDGYLAAEYLAAAHNLDPILAVWFTTPAAGLGQGDAQQLLRKALQAPEDELRLAAVRALGALAAPLVELAPELVKILQADPSVTLRSAAVGALGSWPPAEQVNGWLALGLSDGAEEVRKLAHKLLLERRHPRARAEALALFSGGRRELALAAELTRDAFREDAESAAEARSILSRRLTELAGRPLSERAILLQVLGQIPGGDSARLLLAEAQTATGELRGLSAHRWCVLQASNGGREAQALLAERLAEETDSLRRVDLIWALAFQRTDLAREALRDEGLRPERPELERLFAAERLIMLGPSASVAPLLKRLPQSFHDGRARRALQCLLWRWYG